MTRSLFAIPRMRGKAMVAALPYAVRLEAEAALYREYTARCIRLIGENTAKACGGTYVTAEYTDLIARKRTDERTAEEIAEDVILRAGIEVIG